MNLREVTEPDQAGTAAPLEFAPKKDDSPPFWVEFRKIVNVMKREINSILRMHKCFESLDKDVVLSTLGGNTRYWKVEVENELQD